MEQMETRFDVHKYVNGFIVMLYNNKKNIFDLADYLELSERWNVTEIRIKAGIDSASILISDNMMRDQKTRIIEILNYIESCNSFKFKYENRW